mgnify:CR=1 FL=1
MWSTDGVVKNTRLARTIRRMNEDIENLKEFIQSSNSTDRNVTKQLSDVEMRLTELNGLMKGLNNTILSRASLTDSSIQDVTQKLIGLRSTTTQIGIQSQQLTQMTTQLGDLTGALTALNGTFMNNEASMDNSIDDITLRLETVRNAVSGIQMGSVYTRWGRKSCSSGSTRIYEGMLTPIAFCSTCYLPTHLRGSYPLIKALVK